MLAVFRCLLSISTPIFGGQMSLVPNFPTSLFSERERGREKDWILAQGVQKIYNQVF